MCSPDTQQAGIQQAQSNVMKSMPDYGARPDGSKKGMGYKGEIKRPDGSVMTEVTMGYEIDGKQVDLPLITKYSTKEDIEYLKKANLKGSDFLKNAPAGLEDRAIKHAMDRKKAGLPIYAD